ncbi:TetR/AcrR family transcriptional regulator [Rhodococcus sp. 3.70]
MTLRDAQREATRHRILDAATDLLIADGYSSLTAQSVQTAAGVSRGALLHHFPNMQELTAALVSNIVVRNEVAVRAAMSRQDSSVDTIENSISALYSALTQPPFQAELELWSAARTDPVLAEVLRESERIAGRDLRRVVHDAFGPEIVASENYSQIADLTVLMLRGLALSRAVQRATRLRVVRSVNGQASFACSSPRTSATRSERGALCRQDR